MFRLLTNIEANSNKIIAKRIENEYGFSFPEKFVQFHQTWKVGHRIEEHIGKINKYLQVEFFGTTIFNDKKCYHYYYGLADLMEIEHTLNVYCDADFFLNEEKLVLIGNHISGNGIFLGVGEQNKDKIFINDGESNKNNIEVSDSLFDYINTLEVKYKIPNNCFKRPLERFFLETGQDFLLKQNKKIEIEKLVNKRGKVVLIDTFFNNLINKIDEI